MQIITNQEIQEAATEIGNVFIKHKLSYAEGIAVCEALIEKFKTQL